MGYFPLAFTLQGSSITYKTICTSGDTEFEVSSTCKTSRLELSGPRKIRHTCIGEYDTFCSSCRPENITRHNFLCSILPNLTKISSPFFWWFRYDLHVFLSHNMDAIPLLTQNFLASVLSNLVFNFTPVFCLSSPYSPCPNLSANTSNHLVHGPYFSHSQYTALGPVRVPTFPHTWLYSWPNSRKWLMPHLALPPAPFLPPTQRPFPLPSCCCSWLAFVPALQAIALPLHCPRTFPILSHQVT